MQDLSLVPMDVLIKEIESRSVSIVLAYETMEEKQRKGTAQFFFGKGSWFDAVRLASILNNDVLNNWNGELVTLQRINAEG